MPGEEIDEFGIPIKKTQPEVDEFGIPVKKKESTPSQSPSGNGILKSETGNSGQSGIDYIAGDLNQPAEPASEATPVVATSQTPDLRAATSPLETTAKDQSQFSQDIKEKGLLMGDKKEALMRGIAKTGSLLLQAPAFVYDLAAGATNKVINEPFGIPNAPSADQIMKSTGLNEFSPVNDVEKAISNSKQLQSQKYDKEIHQYLFGEKKDIKKGLNLLTDQILETLPTTFALMAGITAAPVAANAVGLSAFAADKKRQIDESNPDMPENQKIGLAAMNGGMEIAFENLGLTKLGPMIKNTIAKSGAEVGKKEAEELFKQTYGRILKKYIGVHGEEVASEMATQFGQNAVDKYGGVNPDKKLMDGVFDAGLIAFGSSAAISGPAATADLMVTRANKKKAAELLQQKEAVRADLQNPDVFEEVKPALNKKLKDLNEQEADLVSEEAGKISGMTEEKKSELSNLHSQAKEIESAISNETVSEGTKEALQKDLDEVDKKIEDVIKEGQGPKEEVKDPVQPEEEDLQGELDALREMKKEGILPQEHEARLNELESQIGQKESAQPEAAKEGETIKTENNDTQNIEGLPGEVGVGEKPVETKPEQRPSEKEAGTSGVLQTQKEVVSEPKQEKQTTKKQKNEQEKRKGQKAQETDELLTPEEAPAQKAGTPKQKQELLDEEELSPNNKKDDEASVKKLNDDIEVMKKFSDNEVAEKKFVGMIERAYKMKEEGKISRPTYTAFKNKAKEVLGGKYASDVSATEAKLAVSAAMNKVKEKLLGQGYEKLTLSSGVPITPKTIADLIDLTTHLIHKGIDAGYSIAEATKKALNVIKMYPAYKKFTKSGELDEKNFEKTVSGNISKKEKSEKEKVKGVKKEPSEKKKRKSTKSASAHLLNSRGLSEVAKTKIKELGTERDVYGKKEATEDAKALIKEVGYADAYNEAKDFNSSMPSSLRTAIFGEYLNAWKEVEESAKNGTDKELAASMQADASIAFEDVVNQLERISEFGRGIGYLDEFYEASPLGIKKKLEKEIIRENEREKKKMRSATQKLKTVKKEFNEIDKRRKKESESAGKNDIEEKTAPKKKSVAELRKERADILSQLKKSFSVGGTLKSIGAAVVGAGIAMHSPEHGAILAAATPAVMSQKHDEQIKLIARLAKNYIDEGVIHANDLFKKIGKDLKKLGVKLTPDDIKRINEEEVDGEKISNLITNKKTDEEKLKVLEKAFRDKDRLKSKSKAKKEYEKLLDLYENGALEDKKFEDAFYEKFGLLDVNREDVKEKLAEFSQKIHAAPEGRLRDVERQRYMNWLKETRMQSYLDAGLSYWYANILSSYETHARNLQFNALTLPLASALLSQKAIKDGNVSEALGYLKELKEFVSKETRASAASVITTGKISSVENLGISNALERLTGKAGKIAAPFRIPSRLLRASDVMATSTLYNMKMRELMSAMIDEQAKEAGETLTKEQKEKRLNEVLGRTKERQQAATEQATKDIENVYGPDWKNDKEAMRDYVIRKQEIIDSSRPPEARVQAREWARRLTLTNKPEGRFGAISDGVNKFLSNIPVLRMTTPFVNIGLNISSQLIQRSPLGFWRAARGSMGSKTADNGMYYREMTPDERREAWLRATNYTIAIASALTAVALRGGLGGDDDDADFIITGEEGGYYKNQQRQPGGGLKPFTIYVGKKDHRHALITYLNTPFASVFAPIGYIRDYMMSDKKEEKTLTGKITNAAISFFALPLQLASMKGFNDILKYSDPEELRRAKAEGFAKQGAKLAATWVPASGLLKAGKEDVKGLFGLDRTEDIRLVDYLTNPLPFDFHKEKKIDVFGREIKGKFSVPLVAFDKNNFTPTGEPDKYIKGMNEKNYDFTSKFNKDKMMYTAERGDFEMTDLENFKLNKLKGEIALDFLQQKTSDGKGELFDKLMKLDDEEFKKQMNKVFSESMNIAKEEMFLLPPGTKKSAKEIKYDWNLKQRLKKPENYNKPYIDIYNP